MMRRLTLILSLILFAVLCAAPVNAQPEPRTYQPYTPANGDFPNPERGFYHQGEPLWLNLERNPYTLDQMLNLRANQAISVMRWYLLMDELVAVDVIPEETLTYIDSQFDMAREAGMKVIPRVAYNFPQGGTYPYTEPDATLARTLSHISQLTPVLVANADVIAFMEIGFVGAWGEWHSSTNGHVDEGTGINDNSRAIISALLAALPSDRMVAMRYAGYKQQLYGNSPLTAQQAFSGIPQARMGAHNDCFLASNTDWGTYPEGAQARAALRQYISDDNQFLPQGGETCNNNSEAAPYVGCDNAVSDLKLLRFSVLNILYHEDVLQGWRDGGCFESIAKRLGYRLELVESTLPSKIAAGKSLHLNLRLKNVGFASPYNPRGFEIVLRSQADGSLHRPTLANTPDPRRWLPDLGTFTLDIQAGLAGDLPAGTYDVLLNLPDPAPLLYGRPDYSIRLANQGVWEAVTGFNDLLVDLIVTAPTVGVTSELLTNGGFEEALTAWAVTRPVGKPDNDKVVCGGLGAVGTDCAFLFKGGVGERTRLTQIVTLTGGQISASDVLSVTLNYSSRKPSNALSVKIIAQPTGAASEQVIALRATQFTRTTTHKTMPVYDVRTVTLPASMSDSALDSLTLRVQFKNTSGKLYLDDIHLSVTTPSVRGGVLPLP